MLPAKVRLKALDPRIANARLEPLPCRHKCAEGRLEFVAEFKELLSLRSCNFGTDGVGSRRWDHEKLKRLTLALSERVKAANGLDGVAKEVCAHGAALARRPKVYDGAAQGGRPRVFNERRSVVACAFEVSEQVISFELFADGEQKRG